MILQLLTFHSPHIWPSISCKVAKVGQRDEDGFGQRLGSGALLTAHPDRQAYHVVFFIVKAHMCTVFA